MEDRKEKRDGIERRRKDREADRRKGNKRRNEIGRVDREGWK